MQLKRVAHALLLVQLTALAACSGGSGDGLNIKSANDFAIAGDSTADAAANPDAAVAESETSGEGGALSDASGGPSGAQSATDPISDPALGQLADAVDCAQELPCSWVNDSGSLTVTALRADNAGSPKALEVSFRVDVLHDTDVLLGNSLNALDADGERYRPARQRFGDGNGGKPISLLAGDATNGTLSYDKPTDSASLGFVNVGLIDNGRAYSASFKGLPVGSAISEPADCAQALPCVWTSADGNTSVTLVSAGGYAVSNSLGVNFTIDSAIEDDVILDAGSLAVGSDGLPIRALNHRFGAGAQSIKAVEQHVFAGVPVAGSINFYRTANQPGSLARLDIALSRDSLEPRWNPRFTAIPLQ